MKVKKLLALLLTMLMLVSSMAVATLPVLAEGETIPTVYMRSWGEYSGQRYQIKVEGLTIGESYTMKVLYKAHEGKARFYADSTNLMIGGTLQAVDGAAYDTATSTLTYNFAAKNTSMTFGMAFSDYGNWNSAYMAALLIEKANGEDVYVVNPVYEGGVFTKYEGWTNGGWAAAINFEEKAIADFGADMSTWNNPETEVAPCDHVYDDKYDGSCNVCGMMRLARAWSTVQPAKAGPTSTPRATALSPENWLSARPTPCPSCGSMLRALPTSSLATARP